MWVILFKNKCFNFQDLDPKQGEELEQPFHVEKRQPQRAKTVGFSKGTFNDVQTDVHKQERWENRGRSSRLNYNYIFKKNIKQN